MTLESHLSKSQFPLENGDDGGAGLTECEDSVRRCVVGPAPSRAQGVPGKDGPRPCHSPLAPGQGCAGAFHRPPLWSFSENVAPPCFTYCSFPARHLPRPLLPSLGTARLCGHLFTHVLFKADSGPSEQLPSLATKPPSSSRGWGCSQAVSSFQAAVRRKAPGLASAQPVS